MKFDVRKLFSMALACVLLAGMALAEGPGGPRGGAFFGDHMLGFMSDYLDLTDAQQAQVKQIMEKQKSTMQPLFQQEMQSHEQMRQVIESATFDEAKAQSIAAQSAQVHQQLMVLHARTMNEAYQVLTPAQKTKLTQFMAKRQQRFKEHMQHGARPEPPSTE